MTTDINSEAWVRSHLVRIAQSSFCIRTNDGKHIAIDPFSKSPQWPKVDLVLITHAHGDHFNPKIVRSLLKEGTRVVVPASLKATGSDHGLATDTLAPGEVKMLAGWEVTAIRAYNLRKPMHPRSHDLLGYVIALDGLRVYHAGDTDLIPEMSEVKADVSLLPVGGMATMNVAEAVRAAGVIGASVTIPIHYGTIPFTAGAGRKFARLWTGTTVIL
jgi:L-ascorbate metabolism protein UlaG (beta-lactamase superfamily)